MSKQDKQKGKCDGSVPITQPIGWAGTVFSGDLKATRVQPNLFIVHPVSATVLKALAEVRWHIASSSWVVEFDETGTEFSLDSLLYILSEIRACSAGIDINDE